MESDTGHLKRPAQDVGLSNGCDREPLKVEQGNAL